MSHDWDDVYNLITIPLDDVSKTEVYVITPLLQSRKLLSESFRVIDKVKVKVQTNKILKEIKMFESLIKLQSFILDIFLRKCDLGPGFFKYYKRFWVRHWVFIPNVVAELQSDILKEWLSWSHCANLVLSHWSPSNW